MMTKQYDEDENLRFSMIVESVELVVAHIIVVVERPCLVFYFG